MIKYCLNLKNYFSSSFIPYNPKGYTDISQSIQNHKIIQMKIHQFDVPKDQFIFAFNNFIDSIQEDDFNTYAHEVCDNKLGDQFIKGLSRIQNEQLKFEKVVNNDVQEQIYFTDMTVYVDVDRNISLFDHKIIKKSDECPKLVQLQGQTSELLNCFSIRAFIKSKLSIKISNEDHEPDNFHHVSFMVYKDKEEFKSLFQTLKSLLIFNEKEIYLGNNPTWKIIDIDRKMEKLYPQFF